MSNLIVAVSSAAGAIAGAAVQITGPVTRRAFTNADGVATFSTVSAGKYEVRVEASGFPASNGAATVTDGDTVTAPITLTRALTIRSQTLATMPPDRARTRIGVGEEVVLTASAAARWSVSGGGSLSATTGTSVNYRADDHATTVNITAAAEGATATITLEVVAPSFQLEVNSRIRHNYGRPDCGFVAKAFLLPPDVSFEHIEVRELNSPIGAYGFYSPFLGHMHDNKHAVASPPYTVNPPGPDGKGSVANLFDEIYSGDPGGPVAEGRQTMFITWEFRARGGAYHAMPQQQQIHVVEANGTCTTSKAGATATRLLDDPTSSY